MVTRRTAGLLWLWLLAGSACTSAAPLPATAIELNQRGVLALEAGNLDSAATSFGLALEYNPDFVEALSNQGLVELQRGNFERAAQLLRRARRINPDVAQPHHGLGVLAQRQGRADLASQHYRDALSVDPGFAPSRANLARLFFDAGEPWKAKIEFEKLIEVADHDPLAHAGLAETLIRVGRTSEADALVARQLERFPNNGELIVLRARSDLRQGRVTRAVERLSSVTREPGEARVQALGWLGVAELLRNRPRHAVGAARAALRLDDRAPIARHVMATALSRLNDPRADAWRPEQQPRGAPAP